MTETIEVLISNSCIEPAKFLLRNSFEAKRSMEYMVETSKMTRVIAWMVKNIIDSIELAEKASPTHEKGKKYRQSLKDAGFDQVMSMFLPFPVASDDYFSKLWRPVMLFYQ